MYRFSATLIGTSPLLFGAAVQTQREQNELHDDHERRTWRERLNLNKAGQVIISGYALKGAVLDAASYFSDKIRGQGAKTYSTKFQAAFRSDALEFLVLDGDGAPIKSEDVDGIWKFVPSDGKTGGSKRVMRCFPIINEWQLPCRFIITDEIIDHDRVYRYLSAAGSYKGIGMWRPARKGDYGTFTVDEQSVKITQIVL